MTKRFNLSSIFNFSAITLAMILLFGASDSAFAQKKPVAKKPVAKKPVLKKPVAKAKPVAPKIPLYAVETNSKIRVRMNETLSSKTAKAGDTFTTTVVEPVYASNGAIVIPTGSTITGKVVTAKAAAKGGKPGEIDVVFNEVKLPNSKTYVINGSLTELDSKDAKSDTEGTAKGDKMKNRKIIFIGGGGTGGAVLGGIVGGGKGAVIGAIIGGVAGAVTENQTKGEDAEVKSSTEFGVLLNQAVSLPKFVEENQ